MAELKECLTVGISPKAWTQIKPRIENVVSSNSDGPNVIFKSVHPLNIERSYLSLELDVLICHYLEISDPNERWRDLPENIPILVYTKSESSEASQYCLENRIHAYWSLTDTPDLQIIMKLRNLHEMKLMRKKLYQATLPWHSQNGDKNSGLYRTITDAVPCSIFITDRTGNVVYVNKELCHVSGYDEEELIGQNPRIFKSGVHSSEFYTQMWKSIQDGNVWHGEICNRSKHGGLYWERVTILPIRDEQGHFSHFISIRTDDMERRDREALLAIKELAGGIAHQFSQPLQVIYITMSMLEEKMGQDPDFLRMKKMVDSIISLVSNLKNLTNLKRLDYIHEKIIDINASASDEDTVSSLIENVNVNKD